MHVWVERPNHLIKRGGSVSGLIVNTLIKLENFSYEQISKFNLNSYGKNVLMRKMQLTEMKIFHILKWESK
jgi:hypothetical protein